MFRLANYNNPVDFTDVELTPREAILAKCHDCCCYDANEVLACDIKICPLKKFKDMWYRKPRKVYEGDKRHLNTFGR